jgi:ribose-phosphate pyrophosphokinase
MLQRRVTREVEMAFIGKRRAQDVVASGALVGDVANRHVIIIDDLCSSGGTLVRASELCCRARASGVHAAVTHAPLATGLAALLAVPSLASDPLAPED